MRRRWAEAGYPAYPTWIPIVMDGAAVAAALGCAVQRVGEHPMVPVAALVLVALAPWLVGFAGVRLHWLGFAALVVGGATALMVLYPVEYDFGMYLLVMMAGHVGATDTLLRGAAATALAAGSLVALDLAGELDGSGFWVAALVVGWDVGYMMQHQQRALEDQLRTQEAREQQVVLEERQRIAREVHDVIAHSLSVTMLHLTAARRDLEEDGAVDVAEAIDALRDAERLGRQAMSDIRRTVGLLGSPGPAPLAPAPGLAEVPALVEEFRAAGLDVVLDDGVAAVDLPGPVELGIYRILQESLANVAKHQPTASTRVRLHGVGTALHLDVVNDLARTGQARDEPDGLGSGLRGMRERADLLGGTLSVGPEGTRWRVHLEIPVADPTRPDGASRCLPFGVPRRPVEELS